ncbi:MAG: hypothetical protein OXH65_03165 [Paracoccaceae bacterium]|nr:hypothetical protein [Paracoccaceae bacterium]
MNTIAARVDIHKGEFVCFIPAEDWLDLDEKSRPPANLWSDANESLWAGMEADKLAKGNFMVDVPIRDLRRIERNGQSHGWIHDLTPVDFNRGIRLLNALYATPDERENPSTGPQI